MKQWLFTKCRLKILRQADVCVEHIINKYKTYIAHIQYKYFHMHITDDKYKINKSIKSYMYK